MVAIRGLLFEHLSETLSAGNLQDGTLQSSDPGGRHMRTTSPEDLSIRLGQSMKEYPRGLDSGAQLAESQLNER